MNILYKNMLSLFGFLNIWPVDWSLFCRFELCNCLSPLPFFLLGDKIFLNDLMRCYDTMTFIMTMNE